MISIRYCSVSLNLKGKRQTKDVNNKKEQKYKNIDICQLHVILEICGLLWNCWFKILRLWPS